MCPARDVIQFCEQDVTVVFLAAFIMALGTVGRLLALVINLGVLFYLRWRMVKDINVFQATSRVEKAG